MVTPAAWTCIHRGGRACHGGHTFGHCTVTRLVGGSFMKIFVSCSSCEMQSAEARTEPREQGVFICVCELL